VLTLRRKWPLTGTGPSSFTIEAVWHAAEKLAMAKYVVTSCDEMARGSPGFVRSPALLVEAAVKVVAVTKLTRISA
jgi:hypothetical protein